MQKPKPDPLDRSSLMTAAVDLLSRRDYSRHELWRKLSPKAASAEELESVLDDLASRNWQSDERFASMFVRTRTSRGIGPRRLQQELRDKGVDSGTSDSALETVEHDWNEKALEVARKKARSVGYDHPDLKAKLWRFLSYRGFDGDQISRAVHTLMTEDDL